jgi:hypothetical protein
MPQQCFLEHALGLNEQTAVDCFVGDRIVPCSGDSRSSYPAICWAAPLTEAGRVSGERKWDSHSKRGKKEEGKCT